MLYTAQDAVLNGNRRDRSLANKWIYAIGAVYLGVGGNFSDSYDTMTKGELILTITTILLSLTFGLWTTISMTKKAKSRGSKIGVAVLLVILTFVLTIALIPTTLFLRDKMLFIKSTENCNEKIQVYVGQYWKAGQSYSINIDDGQFEASEEFLFDRKVYDRKVKGEYCCEKDSCKVQFRFDSKDTTFYISPTKTKRFFVGSSIDKEFVVGTDENPNFWVIM
jgi:hypothetical protein